MASYDPASYARQFDSAWANWSPADYQGGLPPELVAAIQRHAANSSGHHDEQGNWVNTPNPTGHIVSPDGRWQLSYLQGPNGPEYQLNDLVQGGPGEPFYTFDSAGKLKDVRVGAKAMSGGQGLALVGLSAIGMGALGAMTGGASAAAGAGGTAAGAGAAGLTDLGGGLFLTADGAITGAASSLGGFSSNAGILSSIGAGGGASAMGGAGGGFMEALKAGASTLLGGGGGGGGIGGAMSWTDWISPVMQLVGGAYTANQAGNAADAQSGAAQAGIDETRRQFEVVRQLLAPYVAAGNEGLANYRALSGAAGPQAQQAAITALEGTPQFGSLVRQGEEAILQNASATGGLRGGNTQGALANYRTDVLSGLINQQLGRYGSLVQVGQNSAAGTGSAAMTSGQQVANLLQQQGAAEAGGIVASTNAITNAVGGMGGFLAGRYGGAAPAPSPYGGGVVTGYGITPRSF